MLQKLLLLTVMVAVVLVATIPALGQVGQEFSERRVTSGKASPTSSFSNKGDNVNACPTDQQIANTGNVANEQGVAQYNTKTDDIDFSGSSIETSPSLAAECNQLYVPPPPPPPDLVPDEPRCTFEGDPPRAGDYFVTVTIRNIGGSPARVPFNTTLTWLPWFTFPGETRSLGSPPSDLLPGQSYTFPRQLVPEPTGPILITVDSNDDVVESNEANNIFPNPPPPTNVWICGFTE